MSKPFKLSVVLHGHSLDVRSVAVTSKNAIISGSRDRTAKLWLPNEINTGYNAVTTYNDQKNFVASVLYLEPTNEFPSGLVVTGGNDHLILIYQMHEPFTSFTLKEHSNTVCALTKGFEPNTFLSSSWDCTAKLWSLTLLPNSVRTFTGHTAAIWSVIQLKNGNIVTGCADKTIGVFSKDGFRINTIQGHTDCVRSLVELPDANCFLSASNDATIKVWDYNGSNVDTYYGHTNYIYCIARNTCGGKSCFVSCDEDRTVRYWNDGVNTETFKLPAQSVWTVACLPNGDIVTGSSDSLVRVFTQDENRVASEDALRVFDEEVAALTQQSTQEIGGYKVSDLPGKEALYEPGKKAGEMKMIREPQGVVAYTWVDEGENSHWEKVGDVLGGVNPNAGDKTTYEGKSYDFVFTVDVEDGKPPLKLPYNKGDDPYVAAHKFLEKNILPAAYLDQVVNFILKNSADPNQNQHVDPNYVDPFTGASRYTPSGSGSSAGNSGMNLDPFTGASSYSTLLGSNPKRECGTVQYLPQKDYRTFDAGDISVVIRKLEEFNSKAGDAAVSGQALERIAHVCEPGAAEQNIDVLINLLKWNDDIVFPALDVLRMAIRSPENCVSIFTKDDGFIMNKLKFYTSSECKSPNSMLVAFRVLCNMFLHPISEGLIFKNRLELLENITGLSQVNKNIEIAVTTFLLNLTVLSTKERDEFGVVLLANVLPDVILSLNDCEAQFRGLIAVGTLIVNADTKKIITDKIKENGNCTVKLKDWSTNAATDAETKRKNCTNQVLLHF